MKLEQILNDLIKFYLDEGDHPIIDIPKNYVNTVDMYIHIKYKPNSTNPVLIPINVVISINAAIGIAIKVTAPNPKLVKSDFSSCLAIFSNTFGIINIINKPITNTFINENKLSVILDANVDVFNDVLFLASSTSV